MTLIAKRLIASLPHQAFTAQCAIVIHRDSGGNEKVKSGLKLVFAMLRRRDKARLQLDLKSRPGLDAQLFPLVRSFSQALGTSTNIITTRRMLKRH